MKITHLLFGCILLLSVGHSYGQIEINAAGNIGFGSTAPSSSYTVQGVSSYFNNSYSGVNRTSYSYVYESVGIGMSYGSEYTLAVSPNHSVENVLYISDGNNRSRGRTLFVNGDAVSTGGWHSFSDRRMKKKERRINKNNVLNKLSRVHGKRYQFKSEAELLAMHNSGQAHFPVDTIFKTKKVVNKQGKTVRVPTDVIKKIVIDVPKFRKGDRYGVAAQDVLAEYPELVSLDYATGMYSVDYQGFIPLLIEGFSLQQEEIKVMKKKIRNLKKKVDKLSN